MHSLQFDHILSRCSPYFYILLRFCIDLYLISDICCETMFHIDHRIHRVLCNSSRNHHTGNSAYLYCIPLPNGYEPCSEGFRFNTDGINLNELMFIFAQGILTLFLRVYMQYGWYQSSYVYQKLKQKLKFHKNYIYAGTDTQIRDQVFM